MRRTTETLALTGVLLGFALGVAAASPQPICPSQRDACVDRLIAEMRQGVDRLACDHGAPFAHLYERTTEGIGAWRERAWRNAKRLRAAPSRSARQRVAARIERHASAMARQIRDAFPATADEAAARDAHCHSVSTP